MHHIVLLVPCVLDQCTVTSSAFIAPVFITRQHNTVSQTQLHPAEMLTKNQELPDRKLDIYGQMQEPVDTY